MRDPPPGCGIPSRGCGTPPLSGCGTPSRAHGTPPGSRDAPPRDAGPPLGTRPPPPACGTPPGGAGSPRVSVPRDAAVPPAMLQPRVPAGALGGPGPGADPGAAAAVRCWTGRSWGWGGGALHRVLAPSQLQRVPSRGCSSLRASPALPPLPVGCSGAGAQQLRGTRTQPLRPRPAPGAPLQPTFRGPGAIPKELCQLRRGKAVLQGDCGAGGGTHTQACATHRRAVLSCAPGLGHLCGSPVRCGQRGAAPAWPPGELGRCCCGMSPAAGCHPLWDVTLSVMPPAPGCHPLQAATRCRALPGSPPLAPLQQPNFSPRARAPAARAPRCCCRYFPPVHAARRPAGVVSCLLHYSSLAQRLGRAAAGCWGCWGPLRVAGVLASVALRCLWPEGVGGKPSGSLGCGARGVWGAEGGDAPKVIEPGSGSGTSLVLLRDSTIP